MIILNEFTVTISAVVLIHGVLSYSDNGTEILQKALKYKYQEESALKIIYEWKQIRYAYPNPQQEQYDIKNGDYIPGKPYPVDVDVYYPGECIFI